MLVILCSCSKINFARFARSLCIYPMRSLRSLWALLHFNLVSLMVVTFVVTIRSFARSPPLMPRLGRGSFSHAVRLFVCLFIIRSASASLHFIRSNKFHSRTLLLGCACGSP